MSDASAALARLRDVIERRGALRPGECCDLCGVAIEERHAHLVDLETKSLRCTCRPCALLFSAAGAGARYRAVPERAEPLDVALADTEWHRLQIPVAIAFFFRSTAADRAVAFYPGPAGATESLLPLEDWESLAARHLRVAELVPDVEALLIRKREVGFDGYIVPIDRCYELVGRMRRTWRGLDGGEEVHREIERFFAALAIETGRERPS